VDENTPRYLKLLVINFLATTLWNYLLN
jgi:hypothetical protein